MPAFRLLVFVTLVLATSARLHDNRLRARGDEKCTNAKGSCLPQSSCKAPSVIQKGLCTGSNYCCVSPASSSPGGPAAPNPADAKCTAIKGSCIAQSACKAPNVVNSGLCSGTNMCCAPPGPLDPLFALIDGSGCASFVFDHYDFKLAKVVPSGRAPKSYLRGTALTFAKAVCNPALPWAVTAGAAATTDVNDIFAHYSKQFAAAGLANNSPGINNLRHVFVLLLGLGICESNGKYCTGRDLSQDFTKANTAEAGLYQTSWGAHNRKPDVMGALFDSYRTSNKGCLLQYYSPGISCSPGNWENYGEGDGALWQKRTKDCPSFATEYAAVLTRYSAGPKGEWGPLRRFAASVAPSCDTMFQAVANYVTANKAIVCPIIEA